MPSPRPDLGSIRLAMVPLELMLVDERYQRPLSPWHRTIADLFDPLRLGSLVVNERKASAPNFAVVDGQHRAAALRVLGFREAPCVVLAGVPLRREAELFASLQTDRKSIRPTVRFRAEVVAENPRAVAIDAELRRLGIEVVDVGSHGASTLGAIGAVERAYMVGGGIELPRRVLEVLLGAWRDYSGGRREAAVLSGELLNGLAYLLHRNPERDDRELVLALGETTPSAMHAAAAALRTTAGLGGGSPAYMARAIEEQATRYARATMRASRRAAAAA